MARAAAETGAQRVAFSSDQVYSGAAQQGPLPETLSLSPSNIYGQHKLEAERPAPEALPDAALLRVPWMYDLPGYQLPHPGAICRRNPAAGRSAWDALCGFLPTTGGASALCGRSSRTCTRRLSLPGGAHNLGSSNDRSMVETARQFAEWLGISVAIEITNWHRNLRMDGCKAAAQGITFCSTQEGFARCLREYNLSGGPR